MAGFGNPERGPLGLIRPVRPRVPQAGRLYTADAAQLPGPTAAPRPVVVVLTGDADRRSDRRGLARVTRPPADPKATRNPIRRPGYQRHPVPPFGGMVTLARPLRPDPVVQPAVQPRPATVVRPGPRRGEGLVRVTRSAGPAPVPAGGRPLAPLVTRRAESRWDRPPASVRPPSPAPPVPARPPRPVVFREVADHYTRGTAIRTPVARHIFIEPPPGGARLPRRTLIGVDI